MNSAILKGTLASLTLLVVYFAIISLVSGWSFALGQFSRFWYFVVALAVGFGIQVGLYSYLKTSGKVLVVSGATSTSAMISCCAHYLVNLLPILGAVGVITLISQYQVQLFWVGLAFNFAGIAYMANKVYEISKSHHLTLEYMNKTLRHYEESSLIPAGAAEIFAFIDDHARVMSHMNKPSWMMGGGRGDISFDAGHGQEVGSHIRMSGKAFGITVFVDEIITRYEPPRIKIWETVGTPKLLVIGHYRMKIEIEPQEDGSLLRPSIDYDLPKTNVWLGKLFGEYYAKWCVHQIIKSVKNGGENK